MHSQGLRFRPEIQKRQAPVHSSVQFLVENFIKGFQSCFFFLLKNCVGEFFNKYFREAWEWFCHVAIRPTVAVKTVFSSLTRLCTFAIGFFFFLELFAPNLLPVWTPFLQPYECRRVPFLVCVFEQIPRESRPFSLMHRSGSGQKIRKKLERNQNKILKVFGRKISSGVPGRR